MHTHRRRWLIRLWLLTAWMIRPVKNNNLYSVLCLVHLRHRGAEKRADCIREWGNVHRLLWGGMHPPQHVLSERGAAKRCRFTVRSAPELSRCGQSVGQHPGQQLRTTSGQPGASNHDSTTDSLTTVHFGGRQLLSFDDDIIYHQNLRLSVFTHYYYYYKPEQ